jgi:hypothetical protein
MAQFVGEPRPSDELDREVEREIARLRANPVLLAVRFLADMRASGSWDKPTLDRAIEVISGIGR